MSIKLVAIHLYLAGVRDITAIDIPLGIVRQACFLAGSLGEDKIWFFGEPVSDSDQDMAALIKLVPPGFISLSDTVFDVVFNADSFTEMSSSSASTYFDWVKKNAKSFISINHEANDFRVCDFHSDFIRSLYPLREGYLEEIAFFDYRP